MFNMLHCTMHMSSTKGGLPLLSFILGAESIEVKKASLLPFLLLARSKCCLMRPGHVKKCEANPGQIWPGAQPSLHDARPWKEVEKANPGQGKFRLGPSASFDAVRPWIEVQKANPGQTCLGAHAVQACALHGAGFPWLLAAAFCFLASKLKSNQELTKMVFKLSFPNP